MANGINLENLVKMFETEFRADKTKQADREAAGIGSLQDVIKLFGPGFEAGTRKRALNDATAALSGRGLANTTRPAAISAGLRLESEDRRRAGLGGALTNLANFMGNFRDPFGVTPSVLSHTATGGFSNLLNRDAATEQANQGVRAQNARNLADARATNPFMNFNRGGGGGDNSLDPFGSGDLINLRGSVGGGGSGPSPADLGTGVTAGLAPGSSQVSSTGASGNLTPTEAIRQFSTFSQFKAWAEGQRINAGTESEWAAVKRRMG